MADSAVLSREEIKSKIINCEITTGKLNCNRSRDRLIGDFSGNPLVGTLEQSAGTGNPHNF